MKSYIQFFRKAVCSAVSITMLLAPTWAWGTDTNMKAIGREAQSFGTESANTALQNPPQLNGDSLTIKMPDGKNLSFGTNELTNQTDEIMRQWTPEDIEELKGLFDGSDDEGVDKGTKAKEKLFGDTESLEGQIHQILIDNSNRVAPDWTKDQIILETEKILEQFKTNDITDCKTNTILTEKSQTVHQPKLEQCEQVIDHSGDCQIIHDYRAGVIRHHEGPYNIESCGEGCTSIWLGKVGNNYLPGGSCSLYTDEILFSVTNPKAITKAQLDYAAYDDQMQVWIGPKGKENKVYEGPHWGQFPYEDYSPNRRPGTKCELGTHWIWDPIGDGYGCTERACKYTQGDLSAIDITDQVKAAGKDGVVRFYLRDAIGGWGEAFARIRIYYDPAQAIVDDAWTPPSCVQNVYAINDKFAKGKYSCVEMPTIGTDGCAQIDGVFVCPHHLNPSPLPGISNLCTKVAVSAQYDFYKGQMDCWTDINGNEQCPNNQGGALDKCKALEDRGCQFISTQCSDGALGSSGTCYVNDATYDCGKDIVIKDVESKDETVCSGDISCMGKDCLSITETKSDSFAKITALMNSLQYMAKDMQCTGLDENGSPSGDQDVECSVFAGNPSKCKIAVGGVSDCCENQAPIGEGPYLGMLMATTVGEFMFGSYETNEGSWLGDVGEAAGHGAWSSIGDASWTVAGYLNKFSSFVENINSWKDIFAPSMDVLVDHAKTALELYIKDMLKQLFNTATDLLQDAIQSEMTDQAQQQLQGYVESQAGQMVGAALGAIAAIYAAYCMAVMIIQAVYKCTEEEMQLTAMRDVGNCTYIGSYCDEKVLGVCIKKIRSYCCFSSPLSRIIQQEIRKQGDVLGAEFNGFGSAKSPSCGGLPIEKIGDIDWDRINLDEWIAVLDSNGKLPNSSNIDIEALTGQKSKLNFDGERVNSQTRNEERIKHIDIDAERLDSDKNFDIDTGYRGGVTN